MTYKLKEHVTDEMLKAVGFRGYSDELNYHLVRDVNDDIQVWIPFKKPFFESFYEPRHVYNNHGENKLITPYIQDLIELGYVEVVK